MSDMEPYGGGELVPALFMCPISLDLFKDPVTLCTGQTYDRSCIEKWLLAGNLTCPVTMQSLQENTSMVPNHTLRHLIERWLDSSNRGRPDCGVGDVDYSVAAMRRVLESEESALEDKVSVVERIESLSLHKNHCLIKLDFLGLLLGLILLGSYEEKMGELLEKALGSVLKMIPFSDKAALSAIMMSDETKCGNFGLLFEKGSGLVKRRLSLLLEALASSVETRPVCERLGKSVKLVQHLVEDMSEAGVRGLSALSLVDSNLESLAKNGAVRGLVGYLSSGEKGKGSLEAMAMSVIERLVSVERGKEMLMDEPNGVEVIVKMIFRVSRDEGGESALNSLVSLCCDSEIVREKAVECGVLTQLLLLLQSQCSVKVKTKARMLLKLLGTM